MKSWFAERGVTLPPEVPAEPAAKVVQDERLLGDGSGNGRVNWWDLWYLWHHLTEGYDDFTLDLDAFDIDRDGDADWIDLGLLGDYLYGSGDNPHGIGRPMEAGGTPALVPDPTGVTFDVDGTDWKRFVVRVSGGGSVKVVANYFPEIAAPIMEIYPGRTAPSTNFCGAEPKDTKAGLTDGDVVWLAACAAGVTSIVILDQDDLFLEGYVVTVTGGYASETTFDIELAYIDNGLTRDQKDLARKAADRWESIITEGLPDMSLDFDSDDLDWWDDYTDLRGKPRIQYQGMVDDVRIYIG